MDDPYWEKLKTEVIDAGLETGCGTAVGVSEGSLQYKEINGVLTVVKNNNSVVMLLFLTRLFILSPSNGLSLQSRNMLCQLCYPLNIIFCLR